jgi:hypothetical protein
MTSCKDSRLRDLLAAALWPDEFPGETDLIRRHLAECSDCDRELGLLRVLHGTLVVHKELLESAGSDQLPSETTVSAPQEDGFYGSLEHLAQWDSRIAEQAPDAVVQVEAATEAPCSLTPEEDRMVKSALDLYVPPPHRSQERDPLSIRLRNWLRDSFQPVSLVLGAALASLLIFLVPTGFQERRELVTVASDNQWNFRRMSLMKGIPQGPAPTEAALVILAPRDRPLSPEEIAVLYKEIDLGRLLKMSYSFLSPEDTGKIVGKDAPVSGVSDVRDVVFQKSEVTYLVTFEILNSLSGCAVKGTLFKRGEGHDIGSASQTGLNFRRVPARISAMTMALLEEAVQ